MGFDELQPQPAIGVARFEDIADTAHRLNELRLKSVVRLRPQPPHRRFHHVRARLGMDVPNLLDNRRPRHDFARPLREQKQELHFLRRQMQMPAAARRLVLPRINFQVRHADAFLLPHRPAAQDRPHPREQFRKRERLHEIIVRTKFEPIHAVGYPVGSRQENHRQRRAGRAQFFQHRPAIESRQHDIEPPRDRSSPAAPSPGRPPHSPPHPRHTRARSIPGGYTRRFSFHLRSRGHARRTIPHALPRAVDA